MSQVLLISGSPRKGNTEYILSEIKKLLKKAGKAVELILLRKKKIKECLGCLYCQQAPPQNGAGQALVCKIHDDDMAALNRKLVNSRYIVIGTPTYFDMLSSLLKRMIDRTNPLYTESRLKGKSGSIIAVGAAGRQSIGQAAENVKNFFEIQSIKVHQILLFEGEYPNDVKDNSRYYNKIKTFTEEIIENLK